jgi:hypothetical protein
MIKCYDIWFTGRRVGAIGIFHEINAMRFGADEETAIRNLYDEYEHITNVRAKEWASPFNAETIELFVRNDREFMEELAHIEAQLVRLVGRAARKIAEANREWHDDPESPDHWLFHAPDDMQFPGEVRVKAAAELILCRLRETPAGLNILNQLATKE